MDDRPPIDTPVTEDEFLFLRDENNSWRIPNFVLPKSLHNSGNYVISLGNLCKWLGTQAGIFNDYLFRISGRRHLSWHPWSGNYVQCRKLGYWGRN